MPDGLISVIVPIYNAEPFLEKCVSSIQAQTHKNLEILLIDDGSTDNSSEICEKLAQADKRIKVIHKPNGGVSSARNAGLDMAQGEYIGFIDADDLIDAGMYEQMLARIVETGADVCICGFKMIYDGYERTIRVPHEKVMGSTEIWEALVTDFRTYFAWYASGCNKLIKRNLIENGNAAHTITPPIRFIPGLTLGEDGRFVADCFAIAENGIAFLDITPYNYLKAENLNSATKAEEGYSRRVELVEYWRDIMLSILPNNTAEIAKVIKCQKSVALLQTMHNIILVKQKPTLKLSISDLSTILKFSNSSLEKISALMMFFLPASIYRYTYKVFSKNTNHRD